MAFCKLVLSLFGFINYYLESSLEAPHFTHHFRARTESAYMAAPAGEGSTIVSSVPATLVCTPLQSQLGAFISKENTPAYVLLKKNARISVGRSEKIPLVLMSRAVTV